MSLPDSEPTKNPFAPPTADLGPMAALGAGDARAEAIRCAWRCTEAYVKAVGIAHFVYAVFCLYCNTVNIIWLYFYNLKLNLDLLYSHPCNVTGFFLLPMLAATGVAIGLGLRRLRRWALRLAVLQLILFIGYGGWCMFDFVELGYFFNAGICLFINASYFLITFGLWGPDGEIVTSPEYRAVIRETSHLRVGPRLPVKLTLCLVIIALSIGTLIALGISTRSRDAFGGRVAGTKRAGPG